MDKMAELSLLIRALRLRHSTEAEMQEDLEAWLFKSGLSFKREARLSEKDRVDFLVDRIAVECKVKGPAKGVFRQVERYMRSDLVDGVILVTSFHMGLPDNIEGKPCIVLKAGLAWL